MTSHDLGERGVDIRRLVSMGNVSSPGFTKKDEEEIGQILEHLRQDFTQYFSSIYKSEIYYELVDKQHRGDRIDKESLNLLEAPTPTKVIKVGLLWKQGGNYKTWKHRYFHAMNKQDNYMIKYSACANGDKEKGQIYCYGYRVEPFTEEEKKMYGLHGFKLVSNSQSVKRPWLLRAERDSERREWEAIFASACRNSVPPISEDKTLHEAFQLAYSLCKRKYGFFGQNLLHDSSPEMLESFYSQVIYRDKLSQVFATILATENSSGIGKISGQVNEKVLVAVTSSWEFCQKLAATRAQLSSEIDGKRKSFEANFSALSSDFEQAVSELVSERVDVVLKDLTSRIIKPFAEQSISPMSLAYVAAVNSFYEQLSICIVKHVEIKSKESSLDAVFSLNVRIEEIESSIDYQSQEFLSKSQSCLWEWYLSPFISHEDAIPRRRHHYLTFHYIISELFEGIPIVLVALRTCLSLATM